MRDGVTGVLVPTTDPDALAEALRSVDFGAFDPQAVAAHAQRFSVEAFGAGLRAAVERAWLAR